jgi:spore coat protein U-like protein
MRVMRIILIALAAALVPAATVYAASNLTLQINDVQWQGSPGGGYNGFDPVEYSQTVTFTVRHTGQSCEFFVTFSRGGASDFNRRLTISNDILAYQVYDTVSKSNVLKDLPTAQASEVISGTFPNGNQTRTLSYALVIPPLQIKAPGVYSDSLQVTVYEGNPGQYQQQDSTSLSVTARVLEVVELSLLDSGAPFNPQATSKVVDFGALAQGQSRSIDLRIRGNSRYQVTFQSQYGGMMRHADPSEPSTVPYVLDVDGAAVNLTQVGQGFVGANTGPTDMNGDRHRLRFTVGPVGEAAAGSYRDMIIVTVSALN